MKKRRTPPSFDTTLTRHGWGVACAILLAAAAAPAAEVINDAHIDHAFRYDVTAEEWEISILGFENDASTPPDEAVLMVVDQPYPSEGARVGRPGNSAWDFTGVGATEPIWLLPQSEDFSAFLYAGFRSGGPFAEYFNDDPRLGLDGEGDSANFVTISLKGVRYAGSGAGHFFTYRFADGSPQPWMASADGITEEDVFLFSSGHAHTNMGFSDPGVYEVAYQASGFLGNDGGDPLVGTEPIVSPIQNFYYAVGTYAAWKASYYETHELIDPNPADTEPEVAHPTSDTDGDGAALLLEYAFNLIPVEPDAKSMTPQSGTEGLPAGYLEASEAGDRLVLEYVRRRAEGEPRITYQPQFSSSLDAGWTGPAEETVEPIDAIWERVRAYDTADPAASSGRFGRVLVEME